jgi:hypothetical protein
MPGLAIGSNGAFFVMSGIAPSLYLASLMAAMGYAFTAAPSVDLHVCGCDPLPLFADIVYDGTLMWAPFVRQTVAMVRDTGHVYRHGPGYQRGTDGQRMFTVNVFGGQVVVCNAGKNCMVCQGARLFPCR